MAKDAGITVDFTYDATINGFAAELDSAQRKKLGKDKRVAGVASDVLIQGHHKPPVVLPPDYPAQVTSWGQDRMGLLQSPTAKVDGIDRKRDRVDADVAVLDSGVNASHPDINVAGGYNCLRKGPRNDYADRQGHGSMVAGLVGAIDNSYGVVGVAPGARIWAIRVMREDGSVSLSAALCGFEWVADNASKIDVANLSFGGSGVNSANCGRDLPAGQRDPLHMGICRMVERGVTVVASAGNDSIDASGHLPAAYPEVIAVSAFTETDGLAGAGGGASWCDPLEMDDHIATFSNFGSTIDIAAPGVCLTSLASEAYYFAYGSGTSFAAPYVSGAAALVRARYPWASPALVRKILIKAAEKSPLLGDTDGFQEPILNVAKL